MIRRPVVFLGGALAVLAVLLLMAPTGGFPSRPRFVSVGIGVSPSAGTGDLRLAGGLGINVAPPATDGDVQINGRVGIGAANGGSANSVFASGPLTVENTIFSQGASPLFSFIETDASADEKNWRFGAAAEVFTCNVTSDALSVGENWCSITRTNDTINGVTFTGGESGLTIQTDTGGDLTLNPLSASSGAAFTFTSAAAQLTVARGSTTFAVPLIFTATSAPSGADMLAGDTVRISKSADTSRASTTTLTADPDLQITGLPAGHYMVAYNLTFTLGAGFVNYRPAWTGYAQNVSIRACASGTADVQIVSTGTPGFCLTAGSTIFSASAATIKAFAGGTLSINWAQNASNAAATVLESDSWLEVTRIN